MSFERPSSKEAVPAPEISLFSPATEAWESVRDQVMKLDELCFGDKSFTEEHFREIFNNPESVIVFLKRVNMIIGLTTAVPDRNDPESICINTTDVLPEEQGKGHVAAIMAALEEEARKRGYKFVKRNAAIENGYAEKIHKNYLDRIVHAYQHDSPWGPQQFFKISL